MREWSAAALFAAALSLATTLCAAEPPPNPVTALERALAEQPRDAPIAYFLAWMRAEAGDADGALDALERTLDNGDGFLPPVSWFPSLRDDPRFRAMRARFAQRLPVKRDGAVAFTLPDRRLLPEGIAYDPVSRTFYVGSIARNAIHRLHRDGRLVRFSRPADALDAVLGIAIDARARRLYAVSTSALTRSGRDSPRNAVKVYDLSSGKLVRTFDVPGARQLNDVAIAREALLVTDSAGSGVWRIDLASGSVGAIVPLDTLRGANGIAVSPDGDVAWVAAGRRPVRVDLATGALQPMQPPGRENAAAIDGLYWHDGALIGIQNATTPARVIRMPLSPDGRSIVAVETLQSHHHPAFDEPTTAAITPDGLYVLARTQVSRFNESGRIERPESLAPPQILRVPLAPATERHSAARASR